MEGTLFDFNYSTRFVLIVYLIIDLILINSPYNFFLILLFK